MGRDRAGIHGIVEFDLYSEEGFKAHQFGDPQARIGDLAHGVVPNLITRIGDRYYAERASGVASPPAQIVGMQLGSNSATAVAKTGAGAAIVSLIAGSNVALDLAPVSSLNGNYRRIAWKTTWVAGIGDGTLAEVVLHNQSTATQTVVPEANTISRALIAPAQVKGTNDTFVVNWFHELLGA
jgi:hypothetical protein